MIQTEFADLMREFTTPNTSSGIQKMENTEAGVKFVGTIMVPPYQKFRDLAAKYNPDGDYSPDIPFVYILRPVYDLLTYQFQLEVERNIASFGNQSAEVYLKRLIDRFQSGFKSASEYAFLVNELRSEKSRASLEDKRNRVENGKAEWQDYIDSQENLENGVYYCWLLINFLYRYLDKVWKSEVPTFANQNLSAYQEKKNVELINTNPKSFRRHNWKGSQKQLAELFIELKEKGWIDEINVAAIQQCFTNSKTIGQCLKPGFSKGIANWDGVYTPNYKITFDVLPENQTNII